MARPSGYADLLNGLRSAMGNLNIVEELSKSVTPPCPSLTSPIRVLDAGLLGKPRYAKGHATIGGGCALDLGKNVLFVHGHWIPSGAGVLIEMTSNNTLGVAITQNPIVSGTDLLSRGRAGPERSNGGSRKMLSPTGDRWFESISLQRRVRCEPGFFDEPRRASILWAS
jgi:hypothetical protein